MTREEAQEFFTDRTIIAGKANGTGYTILARLVDGCYATWDWNGKSRNSANHGEYFGNSFYNAVAGFARRSDTVAELEDAVKDVSI